MCFAGKRTAAGRSCAMSLTRRHEAFQSRIKVYRLTAKVVLLFLSHACWGMTMGRTLAAFATSVVALFSMGLLLGTAARADEIQVTPLIVDVLSAPTPVKGADSAYRLVYELQLANSSPVDLELLEVGTFGNGALMFGLSGKELAARFAIGPARQPCSATARDTFTRPANCTRAARIAASSC